MAVTEGTVTSTNVVSAGGGGASGGVPLEDGVIVPVSTDVNGTFFISSDAELQHGFSWFPVIGGTVEFGVAPGMYFSTMGLEDSFDCFVTNEPGHAKPLPVANVVEADGDTFVVWQVPSDATSETGIALSERMS